MKASDHILKSRAAHHSALKAMMPADSTLSGLEVWRKLRRLESRAGSLAVRICNGPEVTEAEQDKAVRDITRGVEKVFGYIPSGFFVDLDPRGWALKLEPGSVPHKLHQDWGGYQILAPLID